MATLYHTLYHREMMKVLTSFATWATPLPRPGALPTRSSVAFLLTRVVTTRQHFTTHFTTEK